MNKTNFLLLSFSVFLAGIRGVPRELYEGSKCKSPTGQEGTCTPIDDCPPALDQLKHNYPHNHTFKRCSFKGFTEIICCPKQGAVAEVRGPHLGRKAEQACEAFTRDAQISLTYHIVGGENADAGEFPHMAALGFHSELDDDVRFQCGGTLISNNYVVTAAHCIINIQNNSLRFVRLGVVDVPESVDQMDATVDYKVENITVHPEYHGIKKFNDIALVRLARNVSFDKNVFPACLYTRDDEPVGLVVTGWGAVKIAGDRSNILQKATLNPVSLSECNSTYLSRTTKTITSNQLCATDDRSDACQGDSGGPLQVQNSNSTSVCSVVGITSFGIGCGAKYPGVYTRIYSYLSWIEGIVWP